MPPALDVHERPRARPPPRFPVERGAAFVYNSGMSFDLQSYLSERRARVEAALQQWVDAQTGVPETLRKAMAYSLLAGGKRLRPLLVLAGCEAVGGQSEVAMPLACALEMIHTYSLVHDDLPSMDNDDFRRGKPTSHKVFGEGMAVLAGDGLLTEALVVVMGSCAPAQVVLEVSAELARAAGACGMVGGQVIDVEATGRKVDMQLLTELHGKKTGALFTASVCGGARLGGASGETLARLRRFSEALGLAFQVIDDVLDATQDLATLGKDPGSDRKAGKTTFIDLLGAEGAQRHADAVMAAGIAELEPLGEAAEPLRALGRYTVQRKN